MKALALALLLLAALVPPAVAAPVADELPQTPEHCRAGAVALAAPAARGAQSGPTVRAVVRAARDRGAISATDAQRYEAAYARARSTRARLSGGRRAELAAVVAGVEGFARRGMLSASRMRVLFGQLEVNTEWWARNDPPRPPAPPPSTRPCTGGTGQGGARVVRDGIVFQWYAGQGLQVQQLGTAGRANALVKACLEPTVRTPCDLGRVRAAMDALAMLAVDRGGFRAWEYYFAFGGGRPPWISGLAQGTAMQALARGSKVLGDARLLAIARSARRAFERRPPLGVRVAAPGGSHYLIYSFSSGLRVLNGFLQSLVGLYDYAEIADDDRARALFAAGERRARREVPLADTGAWSRYSAGGAESDLGYHRLVRDFLRSLCDRTRRPVYCATAERFTAYLHEHAGLRFLTRPRARARRPAAARFHLTKISCVTLRVTRDGRRVATVSRVLRRGANALGWTPPRAGTYRVEVEALDLMNHRTRIGADVRVTP